MDFKLPQSLVSRQIQDMRKASKLDLAIKGIPRDNIEQQEKMLLEGIEPEAKKQVKLYLILAQIAKKENIPIDDRMPAKVTEFLLQEADWQEAPQELNP